MDPLEFSNDSKNVDFIDSSKNEIINNYRISLTERIVRNLAHEIRNPLTNVMLGLEQLKNECPPENDAAAVYFDIIKRNCNRINDLIGTLVNAAKPFELSKSPQSINELLEEVLLLSKEKFSANEIVLNKVFGDYLPMANVDPGQIKEAFINILDNAFHAMSGMRGQLELKTAYQDNQFTITFKDNGIGILPDNLSKVFDPFFKVKSHGKGLGLTLAQNIIASHKGSINVTSNPAEGTIFTITINS
jgi:signal transduction histidine kinase